MATGTQARSFLQSSAVALLTLSAAGGAEVVAEDVEVVVCHNDQNKGGTDKGCPPHQPICVNSSNQSPEPHEGGVNCVTCLNYFEVPQEPDWGCSASTPLCVTDEASGKRPETFGAAGTACQGYPCHNTADGAKEEVDQGCSISHPVCVDGMGNRPSAGRPGIQCSKPMQKKAEQNSSTDQQTKRVAKPSAWGVVETLIEQSRHAENEEDAPTTKSSKARCLILAGDVEPLPWNKAGQLPLCNGCPFGISKQCEIGSKQHRLSW